MEEIWLARRAGFGLYGASLFGADPASIPLVFNFDDEATQYMSLFWIIVIALVLVLGVFVAVLISWIRPRDD